MTEAAKLYRGVHRLLRSAKAAGWKISLIQATGFWRLHHPSGATVTTAGQEPAQ